MMKKIFAILLAVFTVLSVSVLFAQAADTAEVYVTISDKDGKLAVAYEKVTVTDIDNDNALTINDALYAAHEQFYDGGAKEGFATQNTQWGLSLMKLWGTTNGGSYGYMVNDKSAYSMTDPVKADDYVAAYVFTDTKTYADLYSFFDIKEAKGMEQDELTLTLKKNAFDKDWNPVTLPVTGAEITIDGKGTGVFTDENGTATISLPFGKALISATAKDQVLTPPVCLTQGEGLATPDEAPTEAPVIVDKPTEAAAEATAAPTVAPTTATKDSATKTSATSSSATAKTGDNTHLWLWVMIAGLCLCGIIGTTSIYKKHYAKK